MSVRSLVTDKALDVLDAQEQSLLRCMLESEAINGYPIVPLALKDRANALIDKLHEITEARI